MKKLAICLLALVSSTTMANDHNISHLNQEAAGKIKAFGMELKGTLKSAIKQGGLTQGIKVCHSVAPALATQHSKQGWQISRTSLKTRNYDNAPTSWQQKQLEDFEQQLAQGKPAKEIKYSEIVSTGNQQEFRMMKAIGTEAVCLNCHGSNIKPEISQLIQKHYPNDMATGFKLGDIRGAFVLTKKL